MAQWCECNLKSFTYIYADTRLERAVLIWIQHLYDTS